MVDVVCLGTIAENDEEIAHDDGELIYTKDHKIDTANITQALPQINLQQYIQKVQTICENSRSCETHCSSEAEFVNIRQHLR